MCLILHLSSIFVEAFDGDRGFFHASAQDACFRLGFVRSPATAACLESFVESFEQLPSGSCVSMNLVVPLQELARMGETTAVADVTMSTPQLLASAVYTGAVLQFRQRLTALPESFLVLM